MTQTTQNAQAIQATTNVAQTTTLIVSVDDTDDVSKATSTGYIAEQIALLATQHGGRLIHDVSRHQLLLDPSVPYTSHNSAMAFKVKIPAENIEPFRSQAIITIRQYMAPSSDPGLCFASLPPDRKNGLFRRQRRDLIDFGNAAISVYCSQQKAYALAKQIPWITLSAHGGTGQGVVGALAAIGLRLSGNNGRFRGSIDLSNLRIAPQKDASSSRLGEAEGDLGQQKSGDKLRQQKATLGFSPNFDFAEKSGDPIKTKQRTKARDQVQPSNQVSTVAQVCEALSLRLGGKVQVVSSAHQELPASTKIRLSSNVKAILRNHSYTIIANVQDGIANPCGKTDLDELFPKESESLQVCRDFHPDTDTEERIGATASTCVNCLYRRWESQGFSCVVAQAK